VLNKNLLRFALR